MRPATLADVAAIAGVSAKTVSNVMLDRGRVAEGTRQRVLSAANQVGYRPNPAGRGLSSGKTGRVAIVVPMLYQPYFAEIAEGLILALGEQGYATTLRIAPNAAAELAAATGVTTGDVDGVILCPHGLNDDLLADRELPRPFVQLGGPPTRRGDCVVMGEREGAYAAARHLLDLGRRRIALVWNASDAAAPGGDRYRGYLDALADRGVEPDSSLYVYGSDWDRRMSGYEAMVSLLLSGRSFDAALCVNDALAVGAMRALRSHGRRIPDDVAVTGFDDTAEGRFTTPSLTTVNPRKDEMVRLAVEMLLERLGGYDGPFRQVRTGADLVVRRSTDPSSGE